MKKVQIIQKGSGEIVDTIEIKTQQALRGLIQKIDLEYYTWEVEEE